MKYSKLLSIAIFLVLILAMLPVEAFAAQDPSNRGLSITPVRQLLKGAPGQASNGSVTIANLTKSPMQVNLSVQTFSVSDYAYDYRFSLPPDNDWLRLGQTDVTLTPNQSQKIPYSIAVPPKSPAGGQYYTIFATTSRDGGLKERVRVGSLVYFTVEGNLIKTHQILDSKIPNFSFGPKVSATQTIENTGNVHYLANFSLTSKGLLSSGTPGTISHLLMPGRIRDATTTTTLPFWPGIYALESSLSTDSTPPTTQRSYIIYLPPWFIALVILFGWWLMRRFLKSRSTNQQL